MSRCVDQEKRASWVPRGKVVAGMAQGCTLANGQPAMVLAYALNSTGQFTTWCNASILEPLRTIRVTIRNDVGTNTRLGSMANVGESCGDTNLTDYTLSRNASTLLIRGALNSIQSGFYLQNVSKSPLTVVPFILWLNQLNLLAENNTVGMLQVRAMLTKAISAQAISTYMSTVQDALINSNATTLRWD